MKVWLFYLKIDEIDSEPLLYYCSNEQEEELDNEKVILYAFTDKKSIAKEFMAIRNSDVFIPIKTKMSEKEFEYLKESEMEKELFYGSYETRKSKDTEGFVEILTNSVEYDLYESQLENYYDDAFIDAYNNRELLYSIFNSLKKKWIRDIGIVEFQKIIDIGESSATGEYTSQTLSILDVRIDAYHFLFDNFRELF